MTGDHVEGGVLGSIFGNEFGVWEGFSENCDIVLLVIVEIGNIL